MLKKLLKYDLKSMFKFLIIFYSLALFFSVLTRIFYSIDNSFIMNIIGDICSGATIAMIFNILINNIMRLWVRFTNNFYKDESYLTHTLPVEKKILYLSKMLTTIITLFSSIILIIITLFIAYYSKENLETLKNILLPIANIYGSTIIKVLLAVFFILFLEIANILQIGFTGIILGHKKNNNKTLYSLLFGFGIYMITQFFALLTIFIVGIFNKDMMNLFYTNEIINIDMVKLIIYISTFVYTITLFFTYFINIKLLKKGVDVD